ncbi:hypothetical protein ACH5RR_001358 [Cinchona calisaya]|uniref:Uncharacterized protein n=1 Tax=Cinchona calisaya TaxID=153742 RepID=A0ABD3B361_9GENT
MAQSNISNVGKSNINSTKRVSRSMVNYSIRITCLPLLHDSHNIDFIILLSTEAIPRTPRLVLRVAFLTLSCIVRSSLSIAATRIVTEIVVVHGERRSSECGTPRWTHQWHHALEVLLVHYLALMEGLPVDQSLNFSSHPNHGSSSSSHFPSFTLSSHSLSLFS